MNSGMVMKMLINQPFMAHAGNQYARKNEDACEISCREKQIQDISSMTFTY